MTNTCFIAAALVAAGASSAYSATSPLTRHYTGAAGHYAAAGADATKSPKKLCKIKGSWTDTLGGTFTMKSNSKGSFTISACSDPFTIVVSKETKTGFNVTATYGTATDCVATFTEVESFTTCKAATGTLTDANGSFEDDWTKMKRAHVSPPAALSTGLK